MSKEYIKEIEGSTDWICVCGNTANHSGFFACNKQGNEMEPLIGSDWPNLYVCAGCGRIIQLETLEVVGLNKDFKLLP